MWQDMTCDMLRGWTFSKNVSPLALMVRDLWYFEDLEEKADALNQLPRCLKNSSGYTGSVNYTVDAVPIAVYTFHKTKKNQQQQTVCVICCTLHSAHKVTSSKHYMIPLHTLHYNIPKSQKAAPRLSSHPILDTRFAVLLVSDQPPWILK